MHQKRLGTTALIHETEDCSILTYAPVNKIKPKTFAECCNSEDLSRTPETAPSNPRFDRTQAKNHCYKPFSSTDCNLNNLTLTDAPSLFYALGL